MVNACMWSGEFIHLHPVGGVKTGEVVWRLQDRGLHVSLSIPEGAIPTKLAVCTELITLHASTRPAGLHVLSHEAHDIK